MSLLAGLDPQLRPVAEAFVSRLRSMGFNPVITSVRRSLASQRRLYDLRQRTLTGRLRPGETPQRYPVAYPGTSDHEVGWAWDMVTNNNELAAKYWVAWGGSWLPQDRVHFFVR